MIKVLIIYNQVWSYREKIFNLLNEEFDLTVGYSEEKYNGKCYDFKTLYLPVKDVGPFGFHKDGLIEIANKYDVVIGIANIRWLSLMWLGLRSKRKYKIGYWGIGITASYENKFDSKNTWDRFRFLLAKRSDFTIFYSSFPLKRYLNAGVNKEKLFVANNTTEVDNKVILNVNEKRNFLFVGTLYVQKGLMELLEAYFLIYLENNNCPELYIIGDGPEKQSIINYIASNNLENKVILFGSIYNPTEVTKIFNKSLVCISPNQAGLSVLNSMGNATSFVTREDAVTGGEIFNIENKVNGIIYKKEEDLFNVMKWIINNETHVQKMNENALSFYLNHRTPIMMAEKIKEAIYSSIKS